jgi:hypothetical protein
MRLAGGSAEMSTDASGSFGVAEGHDERCRRRVGLSLTYSFVRHADICPVFGGDRVGEPPFVRSPRVCAKHRRRGLPRRCRRHRGRFVSVARNKSCSSLRRGEPASSTTCANGRETAEEHAHIAHMSVTPRTSHRAAADLPPPAVTSIPRLYRSPALDSARERRPCYHPAPTAPNTFLAVMP